MYKFWISSLFLLLISSITYGQHTSTESVLNTGTWKKVCVETDGIYKMDAVFFESMGLDISSIDPKKIKVYGRGGGMLPQSNATARYNDLFENAIEVVGESDGSFDVGDYVLFHGEGPHLKTYSTASISHQINYYSDQTCYFVTVGSTNGKRIEEVSNTNTADVVYTTFDEYKWAEVENTNVLISGREWFGELFRGGSSYEKTITTPGKVSGEKYDVELDVMALSRGKSTQFNVSFYGVGAEAITIPAAQDADYGIQGQNANKNYQVSSNEAFVKLGLYYNNNGKTEAKGYLDYVSINYKRSLSSSSTLFFRVLNSLNQTNVGYEISNATGQERVWDVTNSELPNKMKTTISNGKLSFVSTTDGEIRNFISFTTSQLPSPKFNGAVVNQNLHGITTSPDLLIVTHSDFKDEANRLAAHRRDFNNYTVEVVDIDEIYNEFSAGVQDVSAVRDFAKMLYDRNNGDASLKYLLLFGDASYDYKDRESSNTNFIPIYEAYESLSNIATFSSDDYFGFLEDSEGAWIENSSGNHSLDIGIGRIIVQNLSEAEIVVDKLINYDDLKSAYGNWRNRIAFVADDGDSDLHMKDAVSLTTSLAQNNSQYLPKNVFIDSYQQESASGGEVAPSVNTAIKEQLDKGVLIVNYTGHGGETGWAQEQILTNAMISKFDNQARLPLFVTATCEFGRYDDPKRASGAENLLLQEKGGAIGLVTTTRPVYAYSNAKLSQAFYNQVFTPNSDKSMPAIGDILRVTKNNSLSGVNNRNFSLLGDPSMVLAYPQKSVQVTELNYLDVSSQSPVDTIGALELVTVRGIIKDRLSGDSVTVFNGLLNVTVLDKPKSVRTLGSAFEYKTQESVLFEGKASVINGEFEFQFVVPKDIDYTLGAGKLSFYAIDTSYAYDANGVFTDFMIGGSSDNVVVDKTPPEVNMYLNDTSFKNGGLVKDEAIFIAHVFDQSGINTSNSGIGHEITLSIDGNSQNIIVLNEFYEATENSYQGGVVRYNLSDLPEGEHFIVFRVWDTYNNSTTDTLRFVYGDLISLSIKNNPFDDFTQIDILNQRAGEPVEINAEIFNTAGQSIWQNHLSYESAPATIEELDWDGNNNAKHNLPSGIYVLRLVLRYTLDDTTVVKSSKLVLID